MTILINKTALNFPLTSFHCRRFASASAFGVQKVARHLLEQGKTGGAEGPRRARRGGGPPGETKTRNVLKRGDSGVPVSRSAVAEGYGGTRASSMSTHPARSGHPLPPRPALRRGSGQAGAGSVPRVGGFFAAVRSGLWKNLKNFFQGLEELLPLRFFRKYRKHVRNTSGIYRFAFGETSWRLGGKTFSAPSAKPTWCRCFRR